MRTLFGLFAVVCVNAAAAHAGTPDPDALDRFDRTGETVRCVDSRSTNFTPIDDTRLLVKVGAGTYYLNELEGACRDASSNLTRFETKSFGYQICAGEILKVVHRQSGMFAGSCSFGEFEKLVKKPAEVQAN